MPCALLVASLTQDDLVKMLIMTLREMANSLQNQFLDRSDGLVNSSICLKNWDKIVRNWEITMPLMIDKLDNKQANARVVVKKLSLISKALPKH